ncbi:MAG: D-glycero-beta-D-manno-heptose 1,7-bisphosphate 7-phosphatase [Chloroflexi bacterium AL-W]|nr:D-glycero-beta-D-manno-heptose 1,7-bisphosphate 7-phosphatase [Chloroflexi bacterium AL-N1]NOK64512.1 D-glycero-beta-D-manno-heptose 1,7-bisphosphate 7-phosphatase [Chloroflexi bacterium AL-N10]NOK75754.1 D-glycero-beta-D-manno-heptose 1,7-bisphosphate 7-phosphatase [Chloroflexi bacterium AL-N5]NOK80487.1 D-glycero-beta-D-manno-heptose 1,7-bisphosphate 7-phosphatase [Chloroflexi bacterium AL-W]NOK87001.1 D-glycero-beta-D-manno-heptose 1,7-bisphosphate 7-phosphatase [Chloroflexi bacterium AL-
MRAVFVDRDGVINENRTDHVKSWNEFHFIPGALEALCLLHQAGFQVFVVTNQAMIGRGIVAEQVLHDIHAQLCRTVTDQGGHIHDIRYCPHTPESNCSCRKPQPGMLSHLAAQWNVDMEHAYMIGDAWTDIAAGHAVSCRSILVTTGRGPEQFALPELQQHCPDYIAQDLLHAADWIVDQEYTPYLQTIPRKERIVNQKVTLPT